MNKRLFEVTFRVSILPDGYSYTAQTVILTLLFFKSLDALVQIHDHLH